MSIVRPFFAHVAPEELQTKKPEMQKLYIYVSNWTKFFNYGRNEKLFYNQQSALISLVTCPQFRDLFAAVAANPILLK